MHKICFVFPGQGSQAVGMAKDFYEHFKEAKEVFEQASDAIGYDVAKMCFEGPKEELDKTHITQPCLLTAEIAIQTVLQAKGLKPTAVAGHSLGEYSALVVAKSLSFKDAVKITQLRGKIMQNAVPEGKGLMAAILGLARDVLDDICKNVQSGYVACANYNCPGQIVISGQTEAVKEACETAKAKGAKRAIPLSVSVPSHCALMQDAGRLFEAELAKFEISDAEIAFVNNADAQFISTASDIRASLIRQLSQSVLWEDCVKAIANMPVDCFIEVGPGKVLTGLIQRILPQMPVYNVSDIASLDKTLQSLR